MNNKKGFTLVELLATIVVIALVATIATISITSVIKNTKKDIGNINEEEINKAADLYLTANYKKFKNGSISSFDLYTLRDEKYIDSIPKDEEGNDINKIFVYDLSKNKVLSYSETSSNNFTVDSSGTITNYSGTQTDIVIPSNIDGVDITAINDYVFENKNLTSVVIPNSVTSIGSGAFRFNNLTSVIIGNTVTSIGNFAFQDNNLTSLIIPDSVTSIGDDAFYQNELNNIKLSNNLTSIGASTFRANSLTSIVIPDSVISIGDYAFWENQLTSLTISKNITSIGYGVFYNNKLISVEIPNGVTSIGDMAFANNSLKSLILPNTITVIGNMAFTSNNLTNITIPNSVTSIGTVAFGGNKLTNISIPNSVTNIGFGAFNLNELTDSQAFIYARRADGTVDYTKLISYGGKEKNITIPENTIIISEYAFISCNLNSVKIPSSVTTILSEAFYDNPDLSKITVKGKSSSSEFTSLGTRWNGTCTNIVYEP